MVRVDTVVLLLTIALSSPALRADAPPNDPDVAPREQPQPAVTSSAPAAPVAPSRAEIFLEAWTLVRDNFYDPAMHGVDWQAVRDELLPAAETAPDAEVLSKVINEALGRLRASHMAHYTRDRREYYELLDLFNHRGNEAQSGRASRATMYTGIGLVTSTIDGKIFVADVYEAGPAARVDIRVGDELISVDGQPWSDVSPFQGSAGPRTILLQRTAEPQSRLEVMIRPQGIQPHQMFLDSMRAGARLIEDSGVNVGYVRVRSYGDVAYHQLLREILAGPLRDADGLVLDFRGGWGGASPYYLDVFNPAGVTMVQRSRDGAVHQYDVSWRKPLAILIDGGTRSGKEMLVEAIRKHNLGTLVGERTAGAVLGSRMQLLSDQSMLFMAVADVEIDGRRLEGVGVEPHICVERKLPYCNGVDPQLGAAVDVIVRKCCR